MYYFGNNCFALSPDLFTLLVLLVVDIPSPSDFRLTMFESIINFFYHSVCTPCLPESKDGDIDLPYC